jgi:hypothetical protein
LLGHIALPQINASDLAFEPHERKLGDAGLAILDSLGLTANTLIPNAGSWTPFRLFNSRRLAMFRIRSISLTAFILSAPCSALAQTILYAGASGALVCDSPKPLKEYQQLFNDAEGRAKYLNFQSSASCQRVPKDTAYVSVEPITPSSEILHLRSKEDARNVYVLRREWLIGINATELASMVQAIRACVQSRWNKNAKTAPDVVIKLRLRLNPDGSLASAPTIETPHGSPIAGTISDHATKAFRECEPFKLPRDKYDMWKDVVLFFRS